MSGPKPDDRFHGWVALYDSPKELLAAARRVREAGYKKTDAFTPFPLHGIDEALGIKPTVLPWIVLCCGITGCLTGLTIAWWMNAVDYPYIISGKPYWSLPANIPVGYELTILFSAFGALFGMLALNNLPRLNNPLFTNPKFDRSTDDGFFLYVDRRDPRFDREGVKRLLGETHPASLDEVMDDESSVVIPRPLRMAGIVMALLALIPPLFIMRMRLTKSDVPRFHVFHDMDYQPKKKAQTTSDVFADGRSMRPNVPGTVKRGQVEQGLDYSTGIDVSKLSQMEASERQVLTALIQDSAANQSAQSGAAPATDAPDTTPWLDKAPIEVTIATLDRGQEKFNIYCAVCHGMDGSGNGLVNQRAQQIGATTWQPPSSLHQDYLYVMPDGKLFSTITNGIRKMPGYGSQITADDRWAIVTYVRALQRSRNAKLTDVPASDQSRIREAANP
jgi:mono/diheme cytochrome c family protein